MKINRIIRVKIGKAGGEGLEFKDLKMEFKVNKASSSDPNTCILSIVNLNPDSRNKINVKDSIMELYAGYEEETGDELIFTGNVTFVTAEINRPEVITRIEAGDGDKILKDTKFSVSFKEGSTIYQVVKKAIDSLGLPFETKSFLEPLKSIKNNNGKSYMGTVKKLLDVVLLGTGMSWSIQDAKLKIYQKGKPDNSVAVVLQSGVRGRPNTGLIGSPKRIKIKTGEKVESPEVDGWEIKTLLSPQILPGGTIVVSSREIPDDSKFQINTVEHTGNSTEGEFITTVEGVQI